MPENARTVAFSARAKTRTFARRDHGIGRIPRLQHRTRQAKMTQIEPSACPPDPTNGNSTGRARVRKWKQNEQNPRTCSIRRGIARFVFSFLRARVPSVSKTRGPYVQAAGQGGARGAGTPPGEGGQTQVLAQTCVRKKWGPIPSPRGRDHGHKILVRETAVSFESLS